jgi:hypothetical protein
MIDTRNDHEEIQNGHRRLLFSWAFTNRDPTSFTINFATKLNAAEVKVDAERARYAKVGAIRNEPMRSLGPFFDRPEFCATQDCRVKSGVERISVGLIWYSYFYFHFKYWELFKSSASV